MDGGLTEELAGVSSQLDGVCAKTASSRRRSLARMSGVSWRLEAGCDCCDCGNCGNCGWPSHGMPRLLQLKHGCARSHLSFLDRQKLHEICGCLRRRVLSGSGASDEVALRFIVTGAHGHVVVVMAVVVMVDRQ